MPFSDVLKEKTIEQIKADLGQVDLVALQPARHLRREPPKPAKCIGLAPEAHEAKPRDAQRGVNTDKELVEELFYRWKRPNLGREIDKHRGGDGW